MPCRRPALAAAAAAIALLAGGCAGHPDRAATSTAGSTAATTASSSADVPTTAATAEAAGVPPPGVFAPATATFVTDQLGFALGLSPCIQDGTALCPALLRTSNGGATWAALVPPPLLVLSDPRAHPLLRFASALDGAASDGRPGDPLEVTHDGGVTWHPAVLAGAPADAAVSALAASGGRFTVVAGDSGSSRLWSGPAGGDRLDRVGPSLPGTASALDLSVDGTAGWLAAGPAGATERATYLRTRDGEHWGAEPPPCAVGQRLALAASGIADVTAVCEDPPSGNGANRRTYVSTDGGVRFRSEGPVSGEGYLVGVAAAARSGLVLATSSDVDQLLHSTDQGRTFILTYSSQAAGTGQGLYDLAFTDATHGMVVLGSTGTYALQLAAGGHDVPTTRLLLTDDGGRHWAQAVFVR